MANQTLGKKWEEIFKAGWKQQFPGTLVFRLKDQVTGYKETSQNPCDFLCFPGHKLFMVECKEHLGASIPFTDIPQYERLLHYKDLKNVYPGVMLWLSEKDKVFWVPIKVMEQMVNDGEKSIGLRHIGKYDLIEIPSIKKRVFMESDYSVLLQ